MNKRGWLFLLVLLVLLMLFAASHGKNYSPGTGERIGQIVKLNEQGLFNKTYEAELIRGGLGDGSNIIGTTSFHFTVPDDLAEMVSVHLDKQNKVIIDYKTDWFYWSCNSSSGGHFLTGIRPAIEE